MQNACTEKSFETIYLVWKESSAQNGGGLPSIPKAETGYQDWQGMARLTRTTRTPDRMRVEVMTNAIEPRMPYVQSLDYSTP